MRSTKINAMFRDYTVETHCVMRHSEKGNALFLILIAVVLFAALSYAMTQSNRAGSGTQTETASLQASSVMQYATSAAAGALRMQLRNVAADDVLVSAPTSATYTTEPKRQLFHPDGGGVSWQPTDVNWLDPATKDLFTPFDEHGNWGYIKKNVSGVGTTAEDLIMVFAPLRKNICEAIVTRITGTKNIPVVTETLASFGTLGGAITLLDAQKGDIAHCVKVSDGDIYVYYHVLIAQ